MCLFEFAMQHARAALAERRRLRPWCGRTVEACKSCLNLFDNPLVVDGACRGNHHIGTAVMRRKVAAQHVTVEGLQRLCRSQQRTAHGLIRVTQLVEMLEHDVVGRILRCADFLHDHALFALQLVRHERRIAEDVREHVERQRHIGLHDARIIGGSFRRGAGIEIAADRLDFLHDLARGAPRRAFERHMFEEMRDAMFVGPFVAAADAGPDSKRRSLEMGHGIGDDGKAGGKLGNINAHPATPRTVDSSFAARLTEATYRATSDLSFFITSMRSGLVIKPASHGGSFGRTPQAASTASGNFAACAVDSTILGIFETGVSRSATASATAVWGSTRSPASRQIARIAALVSVSSARPASNSSRIAASTESGSTKRPDCLSDSIRRRTTLASRPLASNNSRSKFDETWISIDGEVEA